MAKTKMTYLFCIDDHRNLAEEVRKRFDDTSRYKVESFYSMDEFIIHFRKGLEPASCKIAILSVPETKEKLTEYNELAIELKKLEPRSGIILLYTQQMADDIRKIIVYNIDAYVPVNQNSVLRIHNAVKKIISENNISINRSLRNISVYVLTGFLIITLLGLLIIYLKFPRLF